jgi:hypothetical protein
MEGSHSERLLLPLEVFHPLIDAVDFGQQRFLLFVNYSPLSRSLGELRQDRRLFIFSVLHMYKLRS